MSKMTLWCGVYDRAAVFPVAVALDYNVSELQQAIDAKMGHKEPNDYRAAQLKLYLARRPGGEWLAQDDALVPFLEGGVDTTYRQMLGSWKLADEAYFGTKFKPGEKEIHVLVYAPKFRDDGDPRKAAVIDEMWRHVFLGPRLVRSAQSNNFKADLCAAYACNAEDGMVRCMLLDTALPSEVVIASHVFPRRLASLSNTLLGISDIDDVCNGLLLFKPLKLALGRFQISFIYENTDSTTRGVFRLKVFDPSIKKTRLYTRLDKKCRDALLNGEQLPRHWDSSSPRIARGTDFDLRTTFGDLEGRALCFKSVTRPFKRCLNFHARLARFKAIEEVWIQPREYDFDDFWSDEMTVAEKMELFFARETSPA